MVEEQNTAKEFCEPADDSSVEPSESDTEMDESHKLRVQLLLELCNRVDAQEQAQCELTD